MAHKAIVISPLENEINLVYCLMEKSRRAIVEAAGDSAKLARLEASNDIDRWRKKFYLIFMRERGLLDLSNNPAAPLELKNMSVNPKSTTRIGDKILRTNWRFWAVYINIIAERLNDFSKATLRSRLFGDESTPGLFTGPNALELLREISHLIDA